MLTKFSKAAVAAVIIMIISVVSSAESGTIQVTEAWARNSAPGAPSADSRQIGCAPGRAVWP